MLQMLAKNITKKAYLPNVCKIECFGSNHYYSKFNLVTWEKNKKSKDVKDVISVVFNTQSDPYTLSGKNCFKLFFFSKNKLNDPSVVILFNVMLLGIHYFEVREHFEILIM